MIFGHIARYRFFWGVGGWVGWGGGLGTEFFFVGVGEGRLHHG